MVKWLKKLFHKDDRAPKVVADKEREVAASNPLEQKTRISKVTNQFLQQHPNPTPFGIHGLIQAGAADLYSSEEVMKVCEELERHGHRYPFSPILHAQLKDQELLAFLKWHAQKGIDKEHYATDSTISALVRMFREETSE